MGYLSHLLFESAVFSIAYRVGDSFAAIAIWLLWLSRDRRASVVFIMLFLGVVAWWLSISPSHDRPWRPEVAVMPRVTIDGDRVHIAGVRNFEYVTSTSDGTTITYASTSTPPELNSM